MACDPTACTETTQVVSTIQAGPNPFRPDAPSLPPKPENDIQPQFWGPTYPPPAPVPVAPDLIKTISSSRRWTQDAPLNPLVAQDRDPWLSVNLDEGEGTVAYNGRKLNWEESVYGKVEDPTLFQDPQTLYQGKKVEVAEDGTTLLVNDVRQIPPDRKGWVDEYMYEEIRDNVPNRRLLAAQGGNDLNQPQRRHRREAMRTMKEFMEMEREASPQARQLDLLQRMDMYANQMMGEQRNDIQVIPQSERRNLGIQQDLFDAYNQSRPLPPIESTRGLEAGGIITAPDMGYVREPGRVPAQFKMGGYSHPKYDRKPVEANPPATDVLQQSHLRTPEHLSHQQVHDGRTAGEAKTSQELALRLPSALDQRVGEKMTLDAQTPPIMPATDDRDTWSIRQRPFREQGPSTGDSTYASHQRQHHTAPNERPVDLPVDPVQAILLQQERGEQPMIDARSDVPATKTRFPGATQPGQARYETSLPEQAALSSDAQPERQTHRTMDVSHPASLTFPRQSTQADQSNMHPRDLEPERSTRKNDSIATRGPQSDAMVGAPSTPSAQLSRPSAAVRDRSARNPAQLGAQHLPDKELQGVWREALAEGPSAGKERNSDQVNLAWNRDVFAPSDPSVPHEQLVQPAPRLKAVEPSGMASMDRWHHDGEGKLRAGEGLYASLDTQRDVQKSIRRTPDDEAILPRPFWEQFGGSSGATPTPRQDPAKKHGDISPAATNATPGGLVPSALNEEQALAWRSVTYEDVPKRQGSGSHQLTTMSQPTMEGPFSAMKPAAVPEMLSVRRQNLQRLQKMFPGLDLQAASSPEAAHAIQETERLPPWQVTETSPAKNQRLLMETSTRAGDLQPLPVVDPGRDGPGIRGMLPPINTQTLPRGDGLTIPGSAPVIPPETERHDLKFNNNPVPFPAAQRMPGDYARPLDSTSQTKQPFQGQTANDRLQGVPSRTTREGHQRAEAAIQRAQTPDGHQRRQGSPIGIGGEPRMRPVRTRSSHYREQSTSPSFQQIHSPTHSTRGSIPSPHNWSK